VQQCFDESFPNGVPEEEEELERQKRDFVSRFKMLAQSSTSHEQLLKLVMTSYDMFLGEIDLRSVKKTEKPETEEAETSWFTVRKQDWLVYFVISLLTIVIKWCDERYASSFAKRNGMERHVFMKVLLPSVLVLGHFFILSMRGQVPTKEAALKKKAEEYEALMASRMTSMEMTQTSSKLIIFAILDFFSFISYLLLC
jgi:hypothetical protein